MSPLTDRAYFLALAEAVCVDGPHLVQLHLRAERSDFLRFNHAAVRQATRVEQGHASLALTAGRRRIESTLSLCGRLEVDLSALRTEREALAAWLPELPEDPYLLQPDAVVSNTREAPGALPSAEAVIDAVAGAASGLDFVGFHAGGPVVRAYADSRGQRNWHAVESFHCDWCLYHAADKAVKQRYAGTHWSGTEFARRIGEGADNLGRLAAPPRRLAPGAYRAYFAPAAMAELLSTLGWGGFGLKARRTGTSSLMKLERGEAAFDARLRLSEAPGAGLAPDFTPDGFARPAELVLAEGGRAGATLVSPRSAREYGAQANGAGAHEAPEALNLAPGTLPETEVLSALGTGLYVSNLWYLNYSDRQACRMTGMTRFACFWVEDGRLAAPLEVMRFDDSFLRLFGPGLLALGDRAEFLPDGSTYGERQLGSVTTPGALVEGLRLTL